jgi:hypothetical protein
MHSKFCGCISYGKFYIYAAVVKLVNSCSALGVRGMVCCKKGMVSSFVDLSNALHSEKTVPHKELDMFTSLGEMQELTAQLHPTWQC